MESLVDGGTDDPCDGVVFDYANPVTGGPTVATMSARIQMLRPGEKTLAHRHTGTTVCHVVEGQGASVFGEEEIEWSKRDCFVVAPLQWHSHQNLSDSKRAVLFTVSDRPALEALGLYREEKQ
jgi:gentisate 1,2-dioxygenase